MDLRTSNRYINKKEKQTPIYQWKKRRKEEYRTTDGMYKNNMWKISNTECKSIWIKNNVGKANEISWEKQIDWKKMNEH